METKLSYYLIDLMKSYINKEDLLSEKSSEIILQIGMGIEKTVKKERTA